MGLLAAAAFSGNDANAQQVYRIVGADGRVTFSDQPPPDANGKANAAPVVALSGAARRPDRFAAHRTAGRGQPLPGHLYTGADCGPCGAGRAMLSAAAFPSPRRP